MASSQRPKLLATRFLLAYLGVIVLLAIPAIASLAFLWNAGELTGFGGIAEFQQEHNAIYGSALNGDFYHYKLELARRRKADIVALGSSRAMQFRQEFFTVPFVNAGGAMTSFDQGYAFLNQLFRFHTPKVVILAVDFWWFNASVPQNPTPDQGSSVRKVTRQKVTSPFKWLAQGKVSPGTFLRVLFARDRHNGLTTWDNVGVAAIKDSTGFRPDGSYQYDDTYFASPSASAFYETYYLINTGTNRFEYGEHIGQRMDDFMKLVNLLRDHGVELVVVSPPVAPAVVAALAEKGNRYGYLQEMQQALHAAPIEYHDFLAPNSASANPCEFVDGFHGGDVVFQRMLLSIMQSSPKSPIASYVNKDGIDRAVAVYSGKTLSIFDGSKYKEKEGDFLGLGCQK